MWYLGPKITLEKRNGRLQQDSVSAHRATNTQTFCEENFPSFIKWEEWPPSSPDLNPMDFCIWSVLESMACKESHKSVAMLKQNLKKEWEKIDMKKIKKCCQKFLRRLDQCILVKGDHFE